MLALLFLTQAFAAVDIHCTFPSKDLQFQLKNYEPSTRIGGDFSRAVAITEKGVTTELRTPKPGSSGRGSAIIGDKDISPAWSIDVKNGGKAYRVVIYYCENNQETYRAKVGIGTQFSEKFADFEAETFPGTCFSVGLQKAATTDCAVFK
jgi:hypothetical protein